MSKNGATSTYKIVQVFEFFSFLGMDDDDDDVDVEELIFDLDFLLKRPMEKDNFCLSLG